MSLDGQLNAQAQQPHQQPTAMATASNIQLPEQFDAKAPDAWPRWKKRFDRYRTASGLSEKDEEVQVSTLVYAMGGEAEDILASFSLSEDDAKKYKTVADKFDGHFVQQRNPIYERARFNQRRQEPGETVDSFITALHNLVQHCEDGTLKEEMIRDRLVVGLLDAKLSETLQLESSLTLAKAVKQARNSEAVRSQQATVRSSATSTTGNQAPTSDVAAVRSRNGKHQAKTSTGASAKPSTQRSQSSKASGGGARKCQWCGKGPHARDQCPARTLNCRGCGKPGHFAAVCRSTSKGQRSTVRAIHDDSEPDFLGAVHDTTSAWTRPIFVHGTRVNMKLDTGADVSAISERVYDQLKPKPE